jgi:undecaprenyl-diphosphatase
MIDYLLSIDAQLFQAINGWHAPPADLFFLVISYLGTGYAAAPIVAIALIRIVPPERLRSALIAALFAMIAAGLLNASLKSIVKRPRPLRYFAIEQAPAALQSASPAAHNKARQIYRVHVVGQRYKSRSFPSGHANTAFAAAAVLGAAGGGVWWLALIPAMLVAYSRVYMGVHFPLDVLAGAALGVCVALAIARKGCRVKKVFHEKCLIKKPGSDAA